MNKKPIHTDFLNHQWKPAPMFYGFKPNVRPYVLPHNRGKLPMPKSGHIYFKEVAALDKAEFNPLPNKPELQLPGKIFNIVPAPQAKFLNAATVKLINSGKVKAIFKNVQKINPLSMPIVSKIADTNLKLISLEMIKNAVIGLKYDPTLGTEQQQLGARSAYDNLIVSYTALVDKRQDNPENIKKLIHQYEKEMIAIYGAGIKKSVSEDILNATLAKINELDSTLTKLYENVKLNGGVLVEPGDFGDVPEEEEEEEVKGPDIKVFSGELPPPYEEAEAEADALLIKPIVSKTPPDDIVRRYENDAERETFIGDVLNNDQQEFNDLLAFMDTNWETKKSYSAKVLQNIITKLLSKENYYNDKNKKGYPEQRVPSIRTLNRKETREDIMNELMRIFQNVIQNMLLDRAEAAKAQAGPPKVPTPPPTPPKQPTPPPSPKVAPQGPPQGPPQVAPKVLDIQGVLNKLETKKINEDLITLFAGTDDPAKTLNDFFDAIAAMDRKSDKAKNVLRRAWNNIDELSTNKYKTLLNAPRNKNAQELEFANFNASLDKLRKDALGLLKQELGQLGPGRKRKSRKRPIKKSVKKISAKVNKEIFRLLQS
jgi:hypothetical protein